MKPWLLLVLALGAGLAHGEIWSFALIGDTPYSPYERTELPKMLAHIGQSGAQFVVHIGDIKHGSSRCDDQVLEDRKSLFNASTIPFVYVPGDNEWTDCGRLMAGAYDPLERLAKLRQLFWTQPQSLGQRPMALVQQVGAYPEHARFQMGPVLFVSLNVPGSGNNRGSGAQASAEFQARHPVVLSWMRESFALAKAQKLAAVVLLFQADPGFEHFAQGLAHGGYREFLETLRQESLNFPGQVVAMHGDTHWHRVDQPLRDAQGQVITNFRRVESYGYPIMGWVKGVVDTDSPTLFRFESHPWP